MLRGLRRALFWEMKKKSCWGSAVRGAAQEYWGCCMLKVCEISVGGGH